MVSLWRGNFRDFPARYLKEQTSPSLFLKPGNGGSGRIRLDRDFCGMATAAKGSPSYCECQVMSTRTGISFLIGMARNDGGSILKSEQVAGTVPVR